MKRAVLRIATRKSPLALWQAEHIKQQLLTAYPELQIELIPLTTSGDRLLGMPLAKVGGKGLFVKELEQALLDERADLAVHCMKDVPVNAQPNLVMAVICEREDPRDAFISNQFANIHELPLGAVVGTASLRRQCLLRSMRPDIKTEVLRGSVNTRLQRLDEGNFAAILLAAAGIKRLGMEQKIRALLDPEQFIPAVGQGALGIECREDDAELVALLQCLNHPPTVTCVTAERALNRALQGGCQVPIAGYATLADNILTLRGMVGKPDGTLILDGLVQGPAAQPEKLGEQLAEELRGKGAEAILKEVYQQYG